MLGNIGKELGKVLKVFEDNEKMAKALEKAGKDADPKDSKLKGLKKDFDSNQKAIQKLVKEQAEIMKKLESSIKK